MDSSMKKEDFVFSRSYGELPEGEFSVEAPSNIALIKYWGKFSGQIPRNPSLSFTLRESRTHTRFRYTPVSRVPDAGSIPEFEILYRGEPVPHFRPKIQVFFERIIEYAPYMSAYRLVLDTYNTFPHSSGIASSASAMAALATGVMEIEKRLHPDMDPEYRLRKTSFLARLGSGSAARSVSGPVMLWGQDDLWEWASDLYAIPYPLSLAEIFRDYRDSILLVDEGQKSISSTQGHASMNKHPFAPARYRQARENFRKTMAYLRDGDVKSFIQVVESEALTLHSLMMSSGEPYILMQPNTLSIIRHIQSYRKESGIPLCFTLDAGANVHILYPGTSEQEVRHWIDKELLGYTAHGKCIHDRAGNGARILTD